MLRTPLRPIAVLALMILIVPPPALAVPSVSMNWQICSGSPLNRNMGSGPVDEVVVTVKGLSGTVRGMGSSIRMQALFAVLPPAWRFDPAGCAAGGFSASSKPTNLGCPALLGARQVLLSGFDYNADLTRGRAFYSGVFDPFVADPTTTYTLARYTFDHTNAIAGFGTSAEACGCLDRPLCIILDSAFYVNDSGVETPFSVTQEYLSWNDPANSQGCPWYWCELGNCPPPPIDSTCVVQATPANARSWGSLKATYR